MYKAVAQKFAIYPLVTRTSGGFLLNKAFGRHKHEGKEAQNTKAFEPSKLQTALRLRFCFNCVLLCL